MTNSVMGTTKLGPKACIKCGTAFRTNAKFFCSRACAGNTKHKLTFTPEHVIWRTMKNRCRNPKCKDYPKYGGRGIDMCDRWWDDFQAFLDDMGPKPAPEYTVERIDNARGYEPDNCKWATRLEQSRNRSCVWTADEIEKLRSARQRGYNVEQASQYIGRTKQAVLNRAYKLGLNWQTVRFR